jgi:hypothetical protein
MNIRSDCYLLPTSREAISRAKVGQGTKTVVMPSRSSDPMGEGGQRTRRMQEGQDSKPRVEGGDPCGGDFKVRRDVSLSEAAQIYREVEWHKLGS